MVRNYERKTNCGKDRNWSSRFFEQCSGINKEREFDSKHRQPCIYNSRDNLAKVLEVAE